VIVPTVVNDDVTIVAGRVVPVNNDAGIEPDTRVPTLVNDDVTMVAGKVVPVNNDAGIEPDARVPTPVIPEYAPDIRADGTVPDVRLLAFRFRNESSIVVEYNSSSRSRISTRSRVSTSQPETSDPRNV
jgi:hypothetical protein